jgi:hypothetical protein
MADDEKSEETIEGHKAARPLRWVKDKSGNTWLCDTDVDPDADMRQQGCWRCDEIAFPTGGR